MRLNKVVGAFVDKHLIAGVDCTSGNHLAAMTKPHGKNAEILAKRVRRRIYKKTLMLTYHARKGKKESHFLWYDLENLVVFVRNDIDVIPTANHKFNDLSHNVWR